MSDTPNAEHVCRMNGCKRNVDGRVAFYCCVRCPWGHSERCERDTHIDGSGATDA